MRHSNLRRKSLLHQNPTRGQGRTTRLQLETTETDDHPLQIITLHSIDQEPTSWNMFAGKDIKLLSQGVLIRNLPVKDAAIATASSIVTMVTIQNTANN